MAQSHALKAAVATSARGMAGSTVRLALASTASLVVTAVGPRDMPHGRRRLRLAGWICTPLVILAAMIALAANGYAQIPAITFFLAATAVGLMQGRRTMPALDKSRDLKRVGREGRLLAVFALVYPLATIPAVLLAEANPVRLVPTAHSPLVSLDYILLDKVALLLLPTLLIAWRLGNPIRQLGLRPVRQAWRWTGPILPAVAMVGTMAVLTAVGRPSLPPGILGVALVTAFVHAGFPEEVFYRFMLQTRLELLLGQVAGIGLTSLLFGLRHLPTLFIYVFLGMSSSAQDDLLLAAACVFGYHTVLGVLYGYLWTRYRNAWANIAVHTLFDTLAFIPLLA